MCCADYYVHPTTGSDSNPGSLGLPFLSIERAVNASIAGDSVWLNAGLYTGQHNTGLIIQRSITIRSVSASVGAAVISCGGRRDTSVVWNAGPGGSGSGGGGGLSGLTIRDCTASAVVVLSGKPSINDCRFTNHTAPFGSSVRVSTQDGASIARSRFDHNRA